MADFILSESNICRLCGQENEHGTDLFQPNEDFGSLCDLINKYLPLKIEDDGKFPRSICPGCNIQVEATKSFFELICEGQKQLRLLWKNQSETFVQKNQLEVALKSVNPAISVQSYTLQSDEDGEKYYIQILSDGPLFPPDHELSLKAEGLDKPRKKRGRPSKVDEVSVEKDNDQIVEDNEQYTECDANGKPKRRIRKPQRYSDIILGNDLEKLYKEEGVLQPDYSSTKHSILVKDSQESVVNDDIDESIYSCDICQKQFTHKGQLDVHRSFHKKILYKCLEPDCNTEYHLENELHDHQRLTDHNKVECVEQDVEDIQENKAEHKNLVDNEYVCKICKKSFNQNILLIRHQSVHNTDRKLYKCSMCDLTFKTRSRLLNHMPKHTGEKRYACEKCPQKFAHKTSLTLHMRWHDGAKPYECDVCLKKFSQKGNLQEHQRIHTGEKPFECEYCKKRFTTSSQHKLHVKSHKGEKPWVCEYCSKAFLHKETWKCHIRRHRNEKPFQCQECFRSFSEQWALTRHKRVHSGLRPHTCDICSKSFADSSNLRKHKRIHLQHTHTKLKKEFLNANQTKNVEEVLYVTYEQDDVSTQKDGPELSELMAENILEENGEVSSDLLIEQIVDNDGNPLSITMEDGQNIKIISAVVNNDRSIQGLLPDGSLVPISLSMVDGKPTAVEIFMEHKTNILQGVDDSSKIEFPSEAGENICLVYNYDTSKHL